MYFPGFAESPTILLTFGATMVYPFRQYQIAAGQSDRISLSTLIS